MTEKRRRAWRFGRLAEELAVWLLRAKGFRVLARDFRAPVGEIDIVARRGGLLIFVEVKARRDIAEAAEAAGARQRARIERAALAFLVGRPRLAGLDMRFDLMLVEPGRWPCHLPDAWRPDS